MYLLFVVFCFRVYLGYDIVSQVANPKLPTVFGSCGILQCIYCLSCFVSECI